MSDFLGSIAQEDVLLNTVTVKTSSPGDNFFKTMIFIEGEQDATTNEVTTGRFIKDAAAFTGEITGTAIRFATVTAVDYTSVVKDGTLLASWLRDLFANGNLFDAILMVYTPDIVDDGAAATALKNTYAEVKDLAYHKTVCAGSDTACLPSQAVALAEACSTDAGLLSSVPYLPYTSATPEDKTSDPLYDALCTADGEFNTTDAFMSAYQDVTRNAALYSLGLALSLYNASGTPVGNNIDYWASNGIKGSGVEGSRLSKATRDYLKTNRIQAFKPVGDGTGNYAAVGVTSLKGNYIQAEWIKAYVQYMVKVKTATLITRPNELKTASSYDTILNILSSQLQLFGVAGGSSRLKGIVITAPSFDMLPPARGNQIIIPNAWTATYVDQIHEVTITGTLIIEGAE